MKVTGLILFYGSNFFLFKKDFFRLKGHRYFGEQAFFKNKSPRVSAKVQKYSIVYYLSKSDFLKIVKDNKRDYEIYCMIRDKIQLYDNKRMVETACFCCKAIDHHTEFFT